MIELRCRFRIAGEFDPENLRFVVLCKTCSGHKKRHVYHEWSLTEIMARVAQGETSGVLHPDSPRFVRWVVKNAA